MRVRNITSAVVIAALFSCMPLAACTQAETQQQEQGTEFYTFYVGTTSQTTQKPVMSVAKAEKTLSRIVLDYCDGFTAYEAKGGWTDSESGKTYEEDTVVITVSGMSYDKAESFASEAAEALDQKSILIQHGTLETEYYSR